MLILLPPSETKTSPTKGPALLLESLWLAEGLGEARTTICKDLVALANGPKHRAVETLGLTPGLAPEVARNAALFSAACAPAIDVYTGVLYEALDWTSLPAAAKRRGQSQVRIFSALFGAIRPLDLIPAYRLSMNVSLPKIGGLSSYWKKQLAILDQEEERLVIDLRSQTYAKIWMPAIAQTASVRVFVEKSGKRTVVSHMAKKTRGEIARAILNLAKSPTSVEDAANSLSSTFKIELTDPAKSRNPYFMDVILKG